MEEWLWLRTGTILSRCPRGVTRATEESWGADTVFYKMKALGPAQGFSTPCPSLSAPTPFLEQREILGREKSPALPQSPFWSNKQS